MVAIVSFILFVLTLIVGIVDFRTYKKGGNDTLILAGCLCMFAAGLNFFTLMCSLQGDIDV